MALETWLIGDVPIGLTIFAIIGAIAWLGRGFWREIAHDPGAFWRRLLTIAPALFGLFVLWTTAFDRWRQLLEEPLRRQQQYDYKRVVLDPTASEVRVATLVLLGLCVVPFALLFARHVGGYAIQVIALLGTIILWGPLFAIRRRLDTNLALGFSGDSSSPTDLVGYGLFLLLDWIVVSALLLTTFVMLSMMAALPLTLLLDLTRLRRPRPTGEANAFFATFAGRAAGIESERHPSAGG